MLTCLYSDKLSIPDLSGHFGTFPEGPTSGVFRISKEAKFLLATQRGNPNQRSTAMRMESLSSRKPKADIGIAFSQFPA